MMIFLLLATRWDNGYSNFGCCRHKIRQGQHWTPPPIGKRYNYYHYIVVVCTLACLINAHVRLFIFQKKSVLCLLIRHCAFINFRKISHPVRLLDTVRLFFSHKIYPVHNFFDIFEHSDTFLAPSKYCLWESCFKIYFISLQVV